MTSANQAKRFNSNKCFRCNNFGHYNIKCSLTGTGQRFCYICKKITEQNGKTCQQRGVSGSRRVCDYNPEPDTRPVRGLGRGKFRENFRSQYRGSFKSRKGPQKQQVGQPEEVQKKKHQANQRGMHSNCINNVNKIIFIADSDATEHIINKSLILSNFKHST